MSTSITRLTVYGTLMATYGRIQEEYMNNVSLVRVNHTRSAREVLEHAQTMPENSIHREVVLCRLTVGELVADTPVQLPIVLSTQV